MKSLIIILVLATSIILAVKSDGQEWRVELLSPQGFRFLIQNVIGIRSASIQGTISQKSSTDNSTEEYGGDLSLQSNGWWTYQNLTASLNPGDTTTFVVVNILEGDEGKDLDDIIINEYEVPDNATRVSV